jgi:hypothetical protein
MNTGLKVYQKARDTYPQEDPQRSDIISDSLKKIFVGKYQPILFSV